MAVCLDYQQVYYRRRVKVVPLKYQIFAALALLLALSVKVWIKTNITDMGYQLAKERQHMIDLDMQRRELELKLSVVTRPDELSRLAKQRLGLQALNPKQARKLSY
ncbi:MAG: hypothetical protein DCC75_04640 [Proteobacteria bacterium]|nr:MAG: hypothetical protein DCC75_04640 [Pseudomonadota bacterium]